MEVEEDAGLLNENPFEVAADGAGLASCDFAGRADPNPNLGFSSAVFAFGLSSFSAVLNKLLGAVVLIGVDKLSVSIAGAVVGLELKPNPALGPTETDDFLISFNSGAWAGFLVSSEIGILGFLSSGLTAILPNVSKVEGTDIGENLDCLDFVSLNFTLSIIDLVSIFT